MLKSNFDQSLLNREESTTFKGFLIVLIIIGHNMFFTHQTDNIQAMGYLYCFHIEAFFIIPFLYGARRLNKKRTLNGFVKLYWPYILLTTIFYLGYYVVYNKNSFNFKDLAGMWIFPNGERLQQFTGIQILWFLPAMFSLTVLKDFYYYSKNHLKKILIVISIVFLIISLLKLDWGKYYNWFNPFTSYFPFGIFSALSFLPLGVFIRHIIIKFKNKEIPGYAIIGLWMVLTSIYFVNELFWNNLYVLVVLRLIFPVVFFILYIKYKGLLLNKIFRNLGNNSFKIYIVHPFFGYMLFFLIPDFMTYNSFLKWIIIVSSVVLITITCLGIARLISKIKFVDKIMFPQNLGDLKSIKPIHK